jgi:hypothetical protein
MVAFLRDRIVRDAPDTTALAFGTEAETSGYSRVANASPRCSAAE